jgi:heptosyltransferase-2
VKVLLIRFSSAGDVLISGELVNSLKKAGHAVHFLTKEEFRDAALAAGAVKVYSPELQNPLEYYEACAKLNAENFGAVIDLHGTLKSVVMSFLVKAEKKAFYSKNTLRRRLMVLFKWFLGRKTISVSGQYMRTAEKAVSVGGVRAEKAFRKAKISKILIHAGAKWRLKRWPYFKELAAGLAKIKGIRITVTGVKDEVENYSEMVYDKISCVRDLTGKTSFKQLLSEIKKADLFVGNDTAAAHAAKLYGVPAVILLGPTVKEFGFITSGDFTVIENKQLLCRPCHVHGGETCPTGGFECMSSIKACEVLAEIKKILKR